MAIVNFTITDTLNKKIMEVVKEKGFQSKAELFRIAVLDYLSRQSEPDLLKMTDEERFTYLEGKLAKTLIKYVKKNKGKKFPTLEEQLAKI